MREVYDGLVQEALHCRECHSCNQGEHQACVPEKPVSPIPQRGNWLLFEVQLYYRKDLEFPSFSDFMAELEEELGTENSEHLLSS